MKAQFAKAEFAKAQFAGAAAAALFAVSAVAQTAAQLTLAFDCETKAGNVMLALYDSEEAFDRGGRPVKAMSVPAGQTATIEGLAPGTYGVKSFQDINGDGKMNTNPFGIPTEPYAFSNNARGHMGPPTWAEARFEVPASGAAQTIRLK